MKISLFATPAPYLYYLTSSKTGCNLDKLKNNFTKSFVSFPHFQIDPILHKTVL